MSDRFRAGEILAGIGAVLLTVLLVFGHWVGATLSFDHPEKVFGGSPSAAPNFSIHVTGGVRNLGWFPVVMLVIAAVAGLLFLYRVATAKNTERPMLQGPVAFTFALLALIVLLIAALLFNPTLNAQLSPLEQSALNLGHLKLSGGLTTTGWIGALSLLLIVVGSWIAFADERTGTAAAKARTAALLENVVPRPAPPATGTASATPDPAEGLDPAPRFTNPSAEGGAA